MPTLPADTRIGRVGLTVADVEPVATFYESVVGLDGLTDQPTTLGVGDSPLLTLEADADLGPRPPRAAGLFHVAYRVPERAALADALSRLRSADALTGASDHLVSEALYAQDPEDNGVEVYCDRPRDAWEEPEPGRVRMDTLPLDLADLATAAEDVPGAPPGTDVGHVHLEVTDLDRAREFYVDTLGFDVMATMQGALFVGAGGYHHHVGLNTWNRRTEPAAGRGLSTVDLVLPDDQALDAVADRLERAEESPQRLPEAVRVHDPDGIELRLVTQS